MNEYVNPYFSNLPAWGSQSPRYGRAEMPSWGSENIREYGDSGMEGEWGTSQPLPYGQALSSASAGFAAGQAGGTPKDFYMDNGQVLGSAASGFASGGPIGAVIGGLTSTFKQDQALKAKTNNVNTSFNGVNDMYGRPTYQSQEFAQGFQDFEGLQEATRPGKHSLMPRRRKQMMEKSFELFQGIQKGQQNYNQAENSFRNRNLQMNDYLERVNNTTYNNLYKY